MTSDSNPVAIWAPPQPSAETSSDADKREAGATALNELLARSAGKVKEYGGPKGLEPTRYGDWERKGRCVDF